MGWKAAAKSIRQAFSRNHHRSINIRHRKPLRVDPSVTKQKTKTKDISIRLRKEDAQR
ncbi:hypothetical protein CY34DRAFT_122394 [Suillus luteus UH-Slu-Lm8-n1]|uniref:Uncharacterized protein n=1 Tax=Suillus luteus UH-Slu-Lm8-n1 TaxID=930992 RepID=A0A0D0C4B0_9AGAM|nr:hypothetical protein CY34DRAFT_122394 [Suillus luteus UH-Slu-Lm8-n1]